MFIVCGSLHLSTPILRLGSPEGDTLILIIENYEFEKYIVLNMTYGKNGGFGKNEVIFQIKVLCICLRPLIQVMCKFEQNWSSSFCIGFVFTQNIFVLTNIYLNSFLGFKWIMFPWWKPNLGFLQSPPGFYIILMQNY